MAWDPPLHRKTAERLGPGILHTERLVTHLWLDMELFIASVLIWVLAILQRDGLS